MAKQLNKMSFSGSEIGAVIYFAFTGVYIFVNLTKSISDLKSLHESLNPDVQPIL